MDEDNHFTFDKDGNIQNINGSKLAYDTTFDAMLPAEIANGNETIKITPEIAKQLAEKVNTIIDHLHTMKKEAENAYQEHDVAIQEVKAETYRQVGHTLFDQLTSEDVNTTLKDIAQSFDDKKNPLFYDPVAEETFINSLKNTISDLEDISGYLSQIGKDFKAKDKILAKWLKL
ncbi:hypothetical protein HOO54_06880 [Bacillus sp. WMMC1349]|nr:hypothetical protein [Bacillus sp. WMMC1349]NPC91942.1 hypothetical protein [Bacillus sp. WMMC1349]